jgi:arylsulfatase B
VFVIADDQGYGDLGCTGNPIVKTPHIDQLASESSGLSDYHVAPTCSPTRCALLTGHWTNRTGVWHTIMGRSMLRENEVTVGQMFADAGYETGMFGKWHLGDNYPYRPEDRGFTEVFRHGGGGVGQTPDLWNNAYFDGSYFHNGKIVPAPTPSSASARRKKSHSLLTSRRTHHTAHCIARKNTSICMTGNPRTSPHSSA